MLVLFIILIGDVPFFTLHFSLLSFFLHSVIIQQGSFVDSETGVVLETFLFISCDW